MRQLALVVNHMAFTISIHHYVHQRSLQWWFNEDIPD